MTSSLRAFALASLMLAATASTSVARAQWGISAVSVKASKNAQVTTTPGSVVTTAFSVKNSTRDSLLVEPILSLPKGCTR